MNESTTTGQCEAQDADWARCLRRAARTIEAAGRGPNGYGSRLCEQHAKRTERAIARQAAS
jgi:hypothetical protein